MDKCIYLRPEDVAEEYRQHYDFDNQKVIKQTLHIRVACPRCQETRWQRCEKVRRRHTRPHHAACWMRKYLRPEDVAAEYQQHYDFAKQEGRKGGLHIWTVCPHCQEARWVLCGAVRNAQRTPYHSRCHPNSPSRRYEERGAVIDGNRYRHLKMWTIDEEDRALAYATSPNKYTIAEHRWIVALHLGRPLVSSEHVHHRNGNRQDNRLANLRLVTKAMHCLAPTDPIANVVTEIEDAARELAATSHDPLPMLEMCLAQLINT